MTICSSDDCNDDDYHNNGLTYDNVHTPLHPEQWVHINVGTLRTFFFFHLFLDVSSLVYEGKNK